ncbi:MAG: Mur ligase domain-containing protein [Sphingomonadales bacterium]|nr:Mur ligase domain-containing protein [Sphingomonadales bacterium]
MDDAPSYFFCGIGGSGMLPLASIIRASGAEVAGSDRALDQGRTEAKFGWLAAQGIDLYPQDGSGLRPGQILVASAAVEDNVPDIRKAKELGLERKTRPELLASLFNAAENGIGVAGTSGKSTVTGMTGWILHARGCAPTIVNGAVMKNFADADAPWASAVGGDGSAFVSEIDESDGSIILFEPDIAILNNVSLDHKSMEELRLLFGDFLAKARVAIVNADDAECRRLASIVDSDKLYRFSLGEQQAELRARDIEEAPTSVSFTVREAHGEGLRATLRVPGRHNVANALAAIAAARAVAIPLADAVEAVGGFAGLGRRFDILGERGGVSVIDDFGHNPDKVAATLKTLHAFPGRLLVFFQPHGYGPLRQMGNELIASFVGNLAGEDILILCDPVYFGGTTDRSVGSEAIVAGVEDAERHAEHIAERAACGDRLVELARPGDRIVVMGARDDSLSAFARDVLERL